MADARGRPRITSLAGSAIDRAEQDLGLKPCRHATADYRIARICNYFVTRPRTPTLRLDASRMPSVA